MVVPTIPGGIDEEPAGITGHIFPSLIGDGLSPPVLDVFASCGIIYLKSFSR
jgi:hypothetical protein